VGKSVTSWAAGKSIKIALPSWSVKDLGRSLKQRVLSETTLPLSRKVPLNKQAPIINCVPQQQCPARFNGILTATVGAERQIIVKFVKLKLNKRLDLCAHIYFATWACISNNQFLLNNLK